MQYTETIATTITSAITTGIITPIGADDLAPLFLPLKKLKIKQKEQFSGLSTVTNYLLIDEGAALIHFHI